MKINVTSQVSTCNYKIITINIAYDKIKSEVKKLVDGPVEYIDNFATTPGSCKQHTFNPLI